ncbi:MAG: GntR family transcriptional regulator [Lachnospiraceae bacterium]
MEFCFDNERPIYIQLVEQLERFIVSGQFTPGERLPSVRELACRSKVNPNTMQRALAELEDRGLVYTERTNGKFVTTDNSLICSYREKYAEQKALRFFDDMTELGFSKKDAVAYLNKLGGLE